MLGEAWRLATRVRNAVDAGPRAAVGLAAACGPRELARGRLRVWATERGEAGRLVDDYRRTTRRASAVVDAVFWA